MADQLATREDLATYLQMDLVDLPEATAELLLDTATAVVQAECGQRLVYVEDDEVELEAVRGNWLHLPERPVTAVTSVTIDDTAITNFKKIKSKLWRSDGWYGYTGRWWSEDMLYPADPVVITVVYSHGYQPEDQRLQLAKRAVLTLAAGAASNPSNAQQMRIDDYMIVYGNMQQQLQAAPYLTHNLRRAYGITSGVAHLDGVL